MIDAPGSSVGPAPLALSRRLACVLMAACLAGWRGTGQAQTQPQASTPAALELQIKAAYLYKFAGFTEWPDGSFAQNDSALLIGVAGHEALAAQLDQIVAGRSVNGHPLAVRRVKRGEALTSVHILFIGALDANGAAELLAQARNQPVLTVTDSADGLGQGAMIAFLMAQERLRFDVALKAVNQARLRISARMLAVAHQVQGAT